MMVNISDIDPLPSFRYDQLSKEVIRDHAHISLGHDRNDRVLL